MMELLNGALTLNQAMMERLRDSPHLVRRGLTLVLLVGLLVGAVHGISVTITQSDPTRVVDQSRAQIDALWQRLAFGADDEAGRDLLRVLGENREPLLNLVRDVQLLPTTLPRPVGGALQGLGALVTMPLSYLGWLVLAVIFTQTAARQLGGQGSLQQMLGLGALSVAPHALDALLIVPAVGPVLTTVAWAWGLAILVAATSVAHRLPGGRAALAVLLYPLIGGFLALLGCCCYLVVVVAVAGGA